MVLATAVDHAAKAVPRCLLAPVRAPRKATLDPPRRITAQVVLHKNEYLKVFAIA
jgi:hypothetical protein